MIREYETITRVQGESITAFIRRFRLVERKLQDAQVAAYPDESRAIKFLDGLRLDEKTTSHILLAAGNKYNFQAILDAVRMQFPAGLTLTGMARPGTSLASSTSAPRRGRGGRGKGRGWKLAYKSWNTNEEADGDGDYDGHDYGENYEAWETAEHYGEEDDYHDAFEDEAALENDVIYENEEDASGDVIDEGNDGDGAQEVLTATSKQMANQKAARGYYDVSNKGKGKKSSKDGKGKGRGGGGSKSSTGGFNQSKGKDSNTRRKGKSGGNNKGKGYGDGGKSERQMRFANSQCLGCGSTKHFLRDCPNVTTYQAHLASALAPGSLTELGEFQSWMVSGSSGSGDGRFDGYAMRARSRSRDDTPAEETDLDRLPHVLSENDLFASDCQFTNFLHDLSFRRIIRDFDRSVQPQQGQCTPDRPCVIGCVRKPSLIGSSIHCRLLL